MSFPTAVPEKVGRYRVVSELGRGSMGRVFLARDPNTDREIAVKILPTPEDLPAEAAAEAHRRFLVEARAAGRLSHPGVVLVYDADVDPESGVPFLAMELVRGRSLAQLLRERGPLPWREAARVGAEIAEALDHAHERGIVHRDVKPGNVLVGDDGRVKVSDFGIARILDDSHTLTGAVLGTPSYMSPEQIRGERPDRRSDVFALGAMLYEMLTGESPFRGDTLATITHKVVYVDPRPPSFARPEVPEGLERIVMRALAKDREARFPTARELAGALAAAARADDSATVVTPIGREAATPRATGEVRPAGPAGGAPRRLPALAAAIAIALVLLGGYWFGRRSAAPESAAPAAAATDPVEGGAAREAAPALRSPPARDRSEQATLQVVFNNRLRGARMTILVDGEKAWSRNLNVPRDPLTRVAGETVRAELRLPPGVHDIDVRIVQESARIDSRGTIRAELQPGQKRWLRVVLIPYVPKLDLDWES
jgi:predicted Ser/Thr protein kinase